MGGKIDLFFKPLDFGIKETEAAVEDDFDPFSMM